MPLRYYECDCGNYFSIFQPIMEKLLEVCPSCKGRLYQDLSGISTTIKKYNTVGSVAEKNTKELGLYERQEKEMALEKEQISFKRKKDDILEKRGFKTIKHKGKPISEKVKKLESSGDKKAIERYIMTGE